MSRDMADTQKSYWKLFNVLGRFVGVCFALAGVIFVILGAAQQDSLIAAVGLVVAVLGVLMVCAKPSRPHGKSSKPSNQL
jgi:uncharacterized membrane protein HdeD (DUF308 family)